ncbi:MAG TPA: glycosyltransferase [Acidimicrobiales bacterium]|nr:glycosyltransferase [Acidimicrobiales bacterium]
MTSEVPRRSLVIPMHREADRIEATIERLAASWARGSATEIIFVDDGSDDGTIEVVENALKSAAIDGKIVALPENRGKGAAVRAGIVQAAGAVVGFTDADLSAALDEVERVFLAVEEGRADVALASRAHPDSRISTRQPALRQLSGKIFNVMLRSSGLTKYRDTQCGLKAFTRDAAVALFSDLRTEGFAFDVEVLRRAELLGFRITEVPIEWRHVEESSVRPGTDGMGMLLDAVRIRRKLRSLPAPRQPMAEHAYDAMARVERSHWWFVAKRALVTEAVERHAPSTTAMVDVGSGTGALLDDLSGRFDLVIGSELDEHSLSLARSTSRTLVRGRAEALPFPDDAAGAISCLDVIEHLDDGVIGLAELGRVVEPGGIIVLAVPAYQWAWSAHDDRLGHRRRYTRRRLAEEVRAAGLEVVRCTYFHSWVVPIAFLLRKTPLRHLLRGEAEEASYVSDSVNAVLSAVVSAERRVLRRFDVPFGLSVFLVARKPSHRSGSRCERRSNTRYTSPTTAEGGPSAA